LRRIAHDPPAGPRRLPPIRAGDARAGPGGHVPHRPDRHPARDAVRCERRWLSRPRHPVPDGWRGLDAGVLAWHDPPTRVLQTALALADRWQAGDLRSAPATPDRAVSR